MDKHEKLEILKEAKQKFDDSVDTCIEIVGSYPEGTLSYDMDLEELITKVESLEPCEECGKDTPKDDLTDTILGMVCDDCYDG